MPSGSGLSAGESEDGMRKVMEITGCCEVLWDDKEKYNIYKVYKTFMAPNKYGYLTKHRKLIEKYADFSSVLCLLRDDALGLDKEHESVFR